VTGSSATLTRRRLVLLCGVIPILAVAVLTLLRPAALTRLDNALYDIMVRSMPVTPPTNQVVIVDIDEHSLTSVGQWPWRRDVVGRLIDRLRELGAAVVAIDIMFPEPDRFSLAGGVDPDAELAAALRKGGVVLGYAMKFEGPDRGTCVLHPAGIALLSPEDDTGPPPLFDATGAICSLPSLATSAGATGFLNAAPDSDGILRRAPLVMQYKGTIYPSLALASVEAVTGEAGLALRVINTNSTSLSIGDSVVPLDSRSNLLLRYRGEKNTFPYISAADVLSGRIADTAVRDKIVFVGTTALGTREVVATPLDTLFVGVEVQATIADNLLRQDFLARAAHATMMEIALVLVLGSGVAWLVLWRGPFGALLGGIAGLGALWFGILRQVSDDGAFVSFLYPALGALLPFAAMTLATVFAERRRADTAARATTTAQQLLVQSLLSLTETRDSETGRHSKRTQEYTKLLAQQLSRHPAFGAYLTPERIDLLSTLAPLHDIGKVGIPDHILNKPGALTPEELATMRTHPTLGYEVILKAERQVGVKDDAILSVAKDIVYTHHERWDGTGYPQGLRATAIPVEGRVLAVVDVYDALVARSLYNQPLSHDGAVEFIRKGRGTHFDPDVADAFLTVAAEFKRLSGAH
jgi:CHASE2 domain-containing sensor protein